MIDKNKWKAKTQKNLFGIADPSYKKHVLDTMKSWADDPDRTPEETAGNLSIIKKWLLGPLDEWLSNQKKKNATTEAATNFSFAIDEIIWGLKLYGLDEQDILKLDEAWTSFLIHADGGGLEFGKTQSVKAAKPRKKSINDIIFRAYREMPEGTAKEIWPGLFPLLEDEFCDNVVESLGNKKQPLTWKYKYSGGALSFKTFQNKLTKIKKEKKI